MPELIKKQKWETWGRYVTFRMGENAWLLVGTLRIYRWCWEANDGHLTIPIHFRRSYPSQDLCETYLAAFLRSACCPLCGRFRLNEDFKPIGHVCSIGFVPANLAFPEPQEVEREMGGE